MQVAAAHNGPVFSLWEAVMICPDCGCSDYLVVDGVEMTEDQLLHLPRAPKKIKRRLPHNLRCPSEANRMWAAAHERRN